VVLAGASMGGTGAIVAAADPALGVDAVVSVSGPAEFGRLDAAAVAGDLGIPALFVVAEDDEPYAGDARVLAGAAGGELVVVPGSAHGTALFDDAPDALSAFLDFVTP
jgi:pimeloyl-ACP methyl ester carboxylesterase